MQQTLAPCSVAPRMLSCPTGRSEAGVGGAGVGGASLGGATVPCCMCHTHLATQAPPPCRLPWSRLFRGAVWDGHPPPLRPDQARSRYTADCPSPPHPLTSPPPPPSQTSRLCLARASCWTSNWSWWVSVEHICTKY